MPSSGYGIESIIVIPDHTVPADLERYENQIKRLNERVAIAQEYGMFVEWLQSFVAAWNATHDVDIASMAGLVEWDM